MEGGGIDYEAARDEFNRHPLAYGFEAFHGPINRVNEFIFDPGGETAETAVELGAPAAAAFMFGASAEAIGLARKLVVGSARLAVKGVQKSRAGLRKASEWLARRTIYRGTGAGRKFLRRFRPGNETVFSGVYDGRKMMLAPSGETLTRGGSVPRDLVDRGRGHGQVAERLGEAGGDAARAMAFTIFYREEGKVLVTFFSRSCNYRLFGDSCMVPEKHRGEIVRAIRRYLGVEVTPLSTRRPPRP